MKCQGLTALVTSASAGLGEEFARQLAKRGANLVLVARSADKLNRLADTLRKESVQVDVLPADLSSSEAVDALLFQVNKRRLRVDILVNNAGLGVFENFLDIPSAKQLEQVDVNIRALVSLTHAFAPGRSLATWRCPWKGSLIGGLKSCSMASRTPLPMC
jgi:short-subunit dehydrogenase